MPPHSFTTFRFEQPHTAAEKKKNKRKRDSYLLKFHYKKASKSLRKQDVNEKGHSYMRFKKQRKHQIYHFTSGSL
jgi:hypothetical protein